MTHDFVRNSYKLKRNNKMSKFDGEFYNKEAQEAVEKVCKEVERLREENAKLREQLGVDKDVSDCSDCWLFRDFGAYIPIGYCEKFNCGKVMNALKSESEGSK